MKKHFAAAVLVAAAVWGCGSFALADPGNKPAAQANIDAAKAAKLTLEQPAPEIDAATLDGAPLTLASLAGKPIILQFGSLTEPAFRMRAADSEKLAAKYADKATFVVIYQRESHPADGPAALEANADAGFAIAKPVTQDERIKLAHQAAKRLKIATQTLLVDDWSDASSQRYGSYPNMTFVIDAKGNLQAGYAWMDPSKVTGALDALLAGKPIPPALRGQTQSGVPEKLDFVTAARTMDGYRGGALALALDKIAMTDKQKEAIYPALGTYLAEGRKFREQFGLRGGPAKRPDVPAAVPSAKAPTSAKNAPSDPAASPMMDGAKMDPAAPAPPATDQPKSAEEMRKAVENLRASAQTLKTAIKENLSEKDARDILDVLSQGPAKRMFAD